MRYAEGSMVHIGMKLQPIPIHTVKALFRGMTSPPLKVLVYIQRSGLLQIRAHDSTRCSRAHTFHSPQCAALKRVLG